MTTTPKDSQQSPGVSQPVNSPGLSSVVISLMTGPFLVTLLGVRTLAETLEQLGFVSEEFFRGVRLPNLHTVPSNEDGNLADTDRE